MKPVDAFLAGLDDDQRLVVNRLRATIAQAHPGLSERIKWNAPSFALNDDDRITLGLERKGGIRVVLHRGAKARDSSGFHFDDPEKLAQWPARDRGVVVFTTPDDVEARAAAFEDLCVRWLKATA